MASLPMSAMTGAVSPAPVASSPIFAAFSPSCTPSAFSPPAAYLQGNPFASVVDLTPGSSRMGYTSPHVGETPIQQAKRFREMQQKWQTAARFFNEQHEKCSTPACSPESASTAPTPSAFSLPAQSPAVTSVKPKAYSPGEMLAKMAECSVSAETEIRSECSTVDSTEASSSLPEPAYVPEHSNVSSDPKLNLTEVPNIGSLSHAVGDCKPCAFFITKGCENGSNCKFCHLCDAGEKKRRLKAKKAHFNALKEGMTPMTPHTLQLSFLM